MALPNPSNFTRILGSHMRAIKEHLEGAAGSTVAYHLRQLSGNFLITLSEAAGATKFRVNDSAAAEMFSVDSDGNVTVVGTLTQSGALILPLSASPAQTADGSVVWDSDDDVLTVGTGAATKRLGLTRGAGSNASATAEMVYDTTATKLKVWNGSASVDSADDVFTSIRTQFRLAVPRRMLAEYSGSGGLHSSDIAAGSTSPGHGLFVRTTGTSASSVATALLLEAYAAWTTAAGTAVVSSGDGTFRAATAPNKNPRMLIRGFLGASSANLTNSWFGFFAAAPTATIDGAYLRANTTGNMFSVTRQSGSETTTDLGARTTANTSYEIYTEDSGVTWLFRNNTTGTTVATHTVNVPTATVALGYGFAGITGSTIVFANVAYFRVESDSVA